jgi:hypothetical protein
VPSFDAGEAPRRSTLSLDADLAMTKAAQGLGLDSGIDVSEGSAAHHPGKGSSQSLVVGAYIEFDGSAFGEGSGSPLRRANVSVDFVLN